MTAPTALLVSRAPSVLEAVRSVRDSVGHLDLDLCPDLDQAGERVRRAEVALVLAHLPAVGEDGLCRLLRAVAATRRACPTLVLADSYREHQAATLLRAGAADYLALPADLAKLTHLTDALTRRLRTPLPP